MEPVAASLLTVGGIALVLGLLAQLVLKPRLRLKYTEDQHDEYSARFNLFVIVGGLVIGLGAYLALSWPPDGPGVITSLLTGLFGAFTAIGAAEAGENTYKARKKPPPA